MKRAARRTLVSRTAACRSGADLVLSVMVKRATLLVQCIHLQQVPDESRAHEGSDPRRPFLNVLTRLPLSIDPISAGGLSGASPAVGTSAGDRGDDGQS